MRNRSKISLSKASSLKKRPIIKYFVPANAEILLWLFMVYGEWANKVQNVARNKRINVRKRQTFLGKLLRWEEKDW